MPDFTRDEWDDKVTSDPVPSVICPEHNEPRSICGCLIPASAGRPPLTVSVSCPLCGELIVHGCGRAAGEETQREGPSAENMDRLLRDMERDDSPMIEVSKEALRGLMAAAREAEQSPNGMTATQEWSRRQEEQQLHECAVAHLQEENERLRSVLLWIANGAIADPLPIDHYFRAARTALREEGTDD